MLPRSMKTAGLTCCVALSVPVLFCAGPLDAQVDRRIEVESRLGVTNPSGEVGEFLESGPGMWLNVRYRVTRQIAVRAEVGRSFLEGARVLRKSSRQRFEIDAGVWDFLTGVDVGVVPFDAYGAELSLRLSVGRRVYDTEETFVSCEGFFVPCPPVRAELLKGSWTTGLGGRLAVAVAPQIRVSVTTDWLRAFQSQSTVQRGGQLTQGFDDPDTLSFSGLISVAF